jgi:UDP-2-acetamido-2,6-beta-L-arabino-hexul-4-ose reductase
VNRARSDAEVREGNVALANDLAAAIRSSGRPSRVVYANSIHAGDGGAYGSGKERAGHILQRACSDVGGQFVDVLLPNLFGEHGRPSYNSFVATFIRATIAGEQPTINDAVLPLAHVQRASQALVAGLTTGEQHTALQAEHHRVGDVWNLLQEFEASYAASGDFPDLSTDFRIDMFNSYRAATFPEGYPIPLHPHTDARGTFVETVRVRGGKGQTSFSTTKPGVTRGNHYHLRKIERFAVVEGEGEIRLRRLFHRDTVTFRVSGRSPAAIDMPIGWAHSITNIGSNPLLTQFWSHELFDPAAPDTFAHDVTLGETK